MVGPYERQGGDPQKKPLFSWLSEASMPGRKSMVRRSIDPGSGSGELDPARDQFSLYFSELRGSRFFDRIRRTAIRIRIRLGGLLFGGSETGLVPL
jgi:hypothetical protein